MFNVSILDRLNNKIESVYNTKNLDIALKIALQTALSYSISEKPYCSKEIYKNKTVYFIYTDTDFYVGIKWVNNNKYTYLGIPIN